MLLTIESDEASELLVDTATVRPDHAAFVFLSSRATTPAPTDASTEEEPRSVFLLAPRGAVRRIRFGSRWRATAVLVPTSNLFPLLPTLPSETCLYAERRLLDRALQHFAEAVLAVDETMSSAEQYAIEQLVAEMGGAVLLDRTGVPAGNGSADAALYARGKAMIAQQCHDRLLTPAAVARESGVSLRRLQTVFAEAGNSIAAEIRRQRARRARALLETDSHTMLSVGQIASEAGFSSSMTLRRALEQEFKSTPNGIRRSARMRSTFDEHALAG